MKINRHTRRLVFRLGILFVALSGPAAFCMPPQAPDLVLLVVVDQLRGDMPWRLRDRLGNGGFRYLMDNGISYTNAHLSHAHTVTAAGHATFVTGGNAAQHGVTANHWYDRKARRTVYSMEDIRYPEIGLPASGADGRGPANLTSSTIGDELILASGERSRAFSASIKDRSAIIMGGHLGKAFWYSEETGRMVSSAYYYRSYPEWVQRWNSGRPADRYLRETWNLLQQADNYVFNGQDDRSQERPEEGMGRVFPHRSVPEEGPVNYAALPYTPMGDRMTLDFVKALFEAERPGRGGSTDLVAVSFSVTDYIGHAFGPFSLEAEDNFLRVDATLAELFHVVDSSVGLDNTLVVLTSDHGVAPIPEYLQERGMPAGRLDAPRFMSDANRTLRSRFSTTRQLALAFENPGIFLDSEAVAALGLDVAVVERFLAAEMEKLPGIRSAYTRSDLLTGRLADTAEARTVLAAFNSQRSGNVILVTEAFWYLGNEPYGSAATHGSPYAYDTHVPIMLAGPGIRHGIVHRRVAARDIAPTVSTYLGTAPPSGSVGEPLAEVLE